MATQLDPIKDAILATLAEDNESASIRQLVFQVGQQYQRSDVSAALWALIREDRVLLTDDLRVRESPRDHIQTPTPMLAG